MSEAEFRDSLVQAAAAAMMQLWTDSPDSGPGPNEDEEARAMLAAVVPLIREQVAREIEAGNVDQPVWDGNCEEAYRECAAIARGGQSQGGGLVRVRISDDYYEHEQFDPVPQTWWSEQDVYEVPQWQVARWEMAKDSWDGAQCEMASLMKDRADRRRAEQAERQRREDARRAEIRAGLYGGRKP